MPPIAAPVVAPAPANPAAPPPAAAPAQRSPGGHGPAPAARAAALAQLAAAESVDDATVTASGVPGDSAGGEASAPVGEDPGAPVAQDPKAAIAAARAAADQRAEEFRTKRDKAAADFARTREIQQQREEFSRRDAEIARLRGQEELAKKDPFAFLAAQGKTAEQLVAEGLKRGDPATKIAAELEQLKAGIEADRKARADAEQVARTQAANASVERYEATFAAKVEAAPAEFPLLAEVGALDGDIVRGLCVRVARQYHKETGETPSHEQILYFVETELSKKKAARAGSAGTQVAGTAAANGPPAGAQVETLTSAQSPGSARSLAELPLSERRKLAAEQIRRMRPPE